MADWAITWLAKKFSLQCSDKISFQQLTHVDLHFGMLNYSHQWCTYLSWWNHLDCISSSSRFSVLEFNQLNINVAKQQQNTHMPLTVSIEVIIIFYMHLTIFQYEYLLCNVLMLRFWLWLLLWFIQSLPLTKLQIISLYIFIRNFSNGQAMCDKINGTSFK